MQNVALKFGEKLEQSLNLPNGKVEYLSDRVILSLPSPCDELGILKAVAYQGEVTISVKNFHTHIDKTTCEIHKKSSVSEYAVEFIEKILNGNYFFHEVTTSDGTIIPGGGPSALTSLELSFFKQAYGSCVELRQWNWFGQKNT